MPGVIPACSWPESRKKKMDTSFRWYDKGTALLGNRLMDKLNGRLK